MRCMVRFENTRVFAELWDCRKNAHISKDVKNVYGHTVIGDPKDCSTSV